MGKMQGVLCEREGKRKRLLYARVCWFVVKEEEVGDVERERDRELKLQF